MNFNQILSDTLGYEGGDTVDSGGTTSRGVTQGTYDSWAKMNKIPTKPVSELTYGDIYRFAKDEFFDKPKISKIAGDKIQPILFDFGYNASPKSAIQALQKIVGTKADGIIGDKTIKKVNSYISKNGEDSLVGALLDARQGYNDNLVLTNPAKYGQYEQGWTNRVEGLRKKYLP
jgi:lysozyme family protein